ncbi:hypothetical protein CAC42_6557 [Sphaceloma murrayae]|uniref:Uncharacterized protein n=1 Tax=Sphaceloma murrayae TaxID=2082308 RepID=A0A2K1QFT5_9PEZI|nr:hypothetical protein CAC42_6557 [Sphaceloma murrayae]
MPQTSSYWWQQHPREKAEYSILSTGGLEEHPPIKDERSILTILRDYPQRKRYAMYASLVFVSSALILAVISGIVVATHHRQTSKPVRLCGNSTAEALSLGCTWDQLTWAWYPPDCPHYANDEFTAADDWRFFTDPWGHEAVGEDWVRGLNNEIQLYSRHGEHLTHCLYLFLSIGQIMRDGTPTTPKLRNYEHLEHCVQM